MQVNTDNIERIDGDNLASFGIDAEGGYIAIASATASLDGSAKDGQVSLLASKPADSSPVPVALLADSFEVISGEVQALKASPAGLAFSAPAQVGSATVTLGTDCPAGTATPTWVKLTINGVAGVVPFFPL